MAGKNRSLLEKYDIPLSHLDFDYLRECKNPREVEKILTILRSGEEGYFPDLMKCAEEKLKKLKPNSKVLRKEEPVMKKEGLSSEVWKEHSSSLEEWSTKMKNVEQKLGELPVDRRSSCSDLPPIRDTKTEARADSKKGDHAQPMRSDSSCIRSTDYRAWDKYDADTEVLKIDLEEERIREEVSRKNKINSDKSKIKPDVTKDLESGKLSQVEREVLANRYKERGNEYFRAKEYHEAAWEYTQSVIIQATPAGYNNRALVHLKMKNYKKCIEDCDSCLQFEPKNIKALLRKGESLVALGRKREAYEVYRTISEIDPQNSTATTQLTLLKKTIEDLPPANAKRIPIVETGSERKTAKTSKTRVSQESSQKTSSRKSSDKSKEEDLAQLIIPNKIVKNKLATVLQDMKKGSKEKQKPPKAPPLKEAFEPITELKLFPEPRNTQQKRVLIEEI